MQVVNIPVGTVVSRARFPWAFERLFEKRQVVAFSSADDLPPEAQVDRQSWMAQGTRSTLLIPIFTGGSVVYTIVINAMKSERVWPEEYFPRLRFLGEILVNALERRNAEQALKTAEEKYRSIFEGALEGIFESTPDGKFLTANAALARILGYDSPEELMTSVRNIGKDVWVSETERAESVQKLEKHGIILKHECRFRRRDGSEIWVSMSARLATGPDGQTFYSGFVEDITERRRAEEALGERLRFEELLSDLSARFVNIPPDRVDSDIEDGLRQILELFQVDRCALLRLLPARSTWQITHAASSYYVPPVPTGVELPSSLFPWAYEKLAEKNEVVSVSRLDDLPAEAAVDRQTCIEWGIRSYLDIPILIGESVYVIYASSVRSEQDWPEAYFPRLRLLGEIFVNALERRNSEQALKTAEEKYRSIFEGALEGIFESSPEGKLLTANAALSRILGYDSPEELMTSVRNIGKDVWVSEQERADYVQRLEKQGVILKHECRFRRRDGSEIWVSLSTRLATGPDGQTFYSGFVEDITERRRAEEALGERLRFEELLSDLSARFVNIPPDRVDSDIEDGLRQILELFQVDRCALLRLLPARSTYQITHAASSDHVPPVPAGVELPSSLYPWAYAKLAEKHEVVSVSRLDDLPPEAAADRQTCVERGIRSYLNIPIQIGESVDVIYASSVRSERVWPEQYFPRLRLLGEVFVNALERRSAEQALRESEERLDLATASAGAGVWVMNVDTGSVWVTDKLRELFGFAPDEELSFESFMDRIHPDDREHVKESVRRSMEKRELLVVEYRIVHPDGSLRWIVSHGRSYPGTAGQPERFMGTSTDVTGRKELEMKLGESRTLLSSLVDSTPDMIWSVDAGRFGLLTFNSGLSEYFLKQRGIQIEIGMRPEDLFPDGEFVQAWHNLYRRALEDGSFTTEYLVSAGTRTLHLNLNRLKRDDVVFGVSVFGQDITERKRMEGELEQRLEEIERLKQQLEKENIYLREDLMQERGFGKIIGSSEALNYVLFRAGQVAPTDATVLILGETGTGKGMVANAIHGLSRRKERPMITVNCAALPANLIESELFGREKGAFTGAHARQSGRFEAADGGTIFLDEIGELPLELQSKLLRVLQDGEFERLGSARTVKVDVRVIAATSRNLRDEVRAGNFREDLFYRLNVFPVTIPPLRERAEDIPELVRFFADKYSRKIGKQIETIPKLTMRALQEYSWPGNVRELEHVIERAVITTEGTVLKLAEHLEPVRGAEAVDSSQKDLVAVEREHILRVLRETKWRIEGPKRRSQDPQSAP